MAGPREEIAALLGGLGAPGSASARRTAPADDLRLEVKGLGPLRFPVSRAQAEELCRLARPARYGRGEETLLDCKVRDTWEVPRSLVKIDRRFDRTLLPVLEGLRADLGLPEGCRLRAELHSLLVYAPGQFFLPHQDSEKADEMIGTLVVTLPSSFKGGALVVQHRGKRATYGATKELLSCVAFYADCRHEVRLVKEGHRIVLTYKLMLHGEGTGAAAEAPAETVDALAGLLRRHFETPLPPRWAWQKDAPPREPPDRLVYLLDHQYTERGFGWNRLKGDDAARVAALRAAAERAGCEVVLALAEVHETWGCMEPGWGEPRYGRRRSWSRDEDDEWAADEVPPPPSADDPDAYELQDLIDSEITLERWIDPSGKAAEPVATPVGDEELCFTTPSSALEPYASEYEGYMGNWGNTMDRWYRRAAVVLWPRERAFAVRAEASPAWALQELGKRLRAGEAAEAREMAESLLSFWKAAARGVERRGFFARALRVAHGLDRPELAASLLEPFRVEELGPAGAKAFAALVDRYGEVWARELLSVWAGSGRRWTGPQGPNRPAWLASLPRLSEALCLAGETAGTPAAGLVLEDSWSWLQEEVEGRLRLERPSLRDEALAELARPLVSFLESAALVGMDRLRDEAVAFFCAPDKDLLVPCLVETLRAAAGTVEPALWLGAGLEAVGEHCIRVLEAQLEEPPRAEDDWSIALPEGCRCELCQTLGAFLSNPARTRLEWPIAKDRRRHVHGRLDAHELPVTHETRRKGSPYTLVLTKTAALFEREAAARRGRQADLGWLTGTEIY